MGTCPLAKAEVPPDPRSDPLLGSHPAGDGGWRVSGFGHASRLPGTQQLWWGGGSAPYVRGTPEGVVISGRTASTPRWVDPVTLVNLSMRGSHAHRGKPE
jgi:hypothetical protein